jgi:cell division cycle 14
MFNFFFAFRLYFTTFSGTPPSAYVLNSSKYTFKPQIRHSNPRCAPPSPDADAAYYYFTIDHQLVYLSFFKDWGPLNLAMVYKACLLIHELLEVRGSCSFSGEDDSINCTRLQDEGLKDHRLVLYASDDPRRKANAALLMALYVVRPTLR